MNLIIVNNYAELAEKTAELFADQISAKQDSILGLATGATVIGVYEKLVDLYNNGDIDFFKSKTFNLDEYWPIKKTNVQSYHYFMKKLFFDHINIKSENVHIPDGELKKDEIRQFCKNYEQKIKKLRGIDFQILGIGGGYYNENRKFIGAHIGFNEPYSDFDSETRLVELSEQTRSDNSRFFKSLENVPHYAITMGLGTIMQANHIVLIAFGDSKSNSIKYALEEPISDSVPASILQKHHKLTVIVDKGAGSKLKEIASPWLVEHIDWRKEFFALKKDEDNQIENAVIWLSKRIKKPIEELSLIDFENNNLSDLVHIYPYQIKNFNKQIIKRLNSKIFGKDRFPTNQKIIVLSPHPDDDVISLGGTMQYLLSKKNKVIIVYMVSGNIAVRNKDVKNYLSEKNNEIFNYSKLNKNDFSKILKLKTKVREFEAKQATKTLGLSEKNLVFLHSPFYETGQIIKNEIKETDWKPLTKLFEKEKPNIILVPGESTDPHGTHGKCIEIFNIALEHSDIDSFKIWYYRGGWEEYVVSEADIVVPFSENIMKKKIEAIKMHRSQLDPVFGGLDPRPFWKRAKDRNQYSGKILETLGLVSKPYAELFKTQIIT